jgi:hypothetical protein
MKRTRIFTAGVVLLCAVQAVTAQVRHEIHFPDLPDWRTLKCDLHTHTVFSDGVVWPTERIDEAWREGLDVIAITDHIEYQPHKQDLPTNHNRPHELAVGRARERDILLIRGAEITRDTPPGHYNAIFLSDVSSLEIEDFYAVFEEAQRQQAFVFWNHPGWQGSERGQWGEHQARLFENKQLHGIEICNGGSYYAYAYELALEKKLTLIGNSDIHDPSLETGRTRTPTEHRTLTLVFAKEKTIEAVREALFAGRTAVWHQNRLIGREPEMAAMFSACVRISPTHHRAGNRAWVKIENRCELDIELQRVGEVGPGRIKLPARATSLLRIDAPTEALSAGLSYRATNFLLGPDKPLSVMLAIPEQ